MRPLVREFREAAEPSGAVGGLGDEAALASRLDAAWERARAAHPTLALSEGAFGRQLGRAFAADPTRPPESLAIEDLYLACACAEGVAGAAEAFERGYANVVLRAVARVLPDASDRAEAAQLAKRGLLLGGEDGAPKLGQYHGHGALEAWVSVAAIRTAVSMGRSERAQDRLRERVAREAVNAASPESLVLKGELRRAMEAAMSGALERLGDRDRLVLRFYLVSGMTTAEIGKTYGVAQSTVSRWLADARAAVLDDVRRQLGERLDLASNDLASIAQLVASQLDVSISRLLGAA